MLKKSANNFRDLISSRERTFTGAVRMRDEWLALMDGIDLITCTDFEETSEYPRHMMVWAVINKKSLIGRRKITRLLQRIGMD